ncbi:alpha/beta fold hydrolase [Flavobacterium psychrophilum]|nr:alpha/beta fold hydrolase [Flavobacterium psychrophilum]EKT4510691.1 alpha/beta fold hydrolase [Flavobacterium psychrophilum]
MKKKLMKFAKIIVAIISTLIIAYYLGPKPSTPKLEAIIFKLPDDLHTLEQNINLEEKATKGIRENCEAKILWADTSKKVKTKYAFLYIHGFGASQMEADPIHKNIAKKYSANLYLSRLAGHGTDLGDNTMANVTADDFANSVEKALAVTKLLGEDVIVISNSFGGALSLYLASKHLEIKALVLYSPCIKSYDENAEIFVKPWGLKMVTLFTGSRVFDYKPFNTEYAKYWTTHYDFNGLAEFQNFLVHTMKKETFEKVKCPVFMGYWYKNETVKDTIASIPAMLKMFDELESPTKEKVAFQNVANHEMTTPILSKDIETVQSETENFLDKVIGD